MATNVGLLARYDMFKASTVFGQQILGLPKSILEQNTPGNTHSLEYILRDDKALLPPDIVMFTQE